MPITATLPGVQVFATLNDGTVSPTNYQFCPEYPDASHPTTRKYADITTIRYIDRITDAKFMDHAHIVECYANDKCLSFELIIDGRKVTSLGGYDTKNGLVEDGDKERVEADEALVAEGWGEIQVRVSGIQIMRRNTYKQSRKSTKAMGEDRGDELVELEFAEKALKGLDVTHGVKKAEAGELVEMQHEKTLQARYVSNSPLAIFIFRYRSRDTLIKSMIIDDLSDLMHDELVKRARQLQNENRRQLELPVKAERGVKGERQETEGDKEPIDLTQDAPKRPRVEIDLTDD